MNEGRKSVQGWEQYEDSKLHDIVETCRTVYHRAITEHRDILGFEEMKTFSVSSYVYRPMHV